MTDVRSMLKRVAALERGRAPAPSPFQLAYGSVAAWEAEVQAQVNAGALDRIDMQGVVMAIRRWHEHDVWATFVRGSGGYLA